MNVTQVTEFGKVSYVHVVMNTYSGFLMAVTQTEEATKYVTTNLKCLFIYANS